MFFLTSGYKVSVSRKVLKNFTISSGTTVPAEHSISVPLRTTHEDAVVFGVCPQCLLFLNA
jgi:hypothetical protein